MSKNDLLDIALQGISEEQDWIRLQDICECAHKVNLDELSHDGKVRTFNMEIRENYGNTMNNIKCITGETGKILKNVFTSKAKSIFKKPMEPKDKDNKQQSEISDIFHLAKYKPDYSEILIGTAEKMDVQQIPGGELDSNNIEQLELDVLKRTLEKLREFIVKDDGWDETNWIKIESMAVKAALEEKVLYEEEMELLMNLKAKGLLHAIQDGDIDGFPLYIIVRQLFLCIRKYLIEGVTKVVSDPFGPIWDFVIGKILARWGIEIDSRIILADWKKTINTVIFIALLRQKQKYADRMGRVIEI